MAREKETMEQIVTLEREKENLARELASYINKEKDKVIIMYRDCRRRGLTDVTAPKLLLKQEMFPLFQTATNRRKILLNFWDEE